MDCSWRAALLTQLEKNPAATETQHSRKSINSKKKDICAKPQIAGRRKLLNIGKPARSMFQSKGTARPEALGRTHRKLLWSQMMLGGTRGQTPWGLEGHYKAFGFYYC